jgi:hypothetical protein
LTIEKAFNDAIGVADAVTDQDISKEIERHLATEAEKSTVGKESIWGLDKLQEQDIKLNPIPIKNPVELFEPPQPNDDLITTLFEALYMEGNPQVITLHENGVVGRSQKTAAILNNIPHPIGIHLQRLLSPQFPTEYSEDTPNKFGIVRLQQIAQLYHTATEFLAIVMIAQIWELTLKFQDIFIIDPFIKEKLNEYIDIDQETRTTYNFIPLIQTLREYLSSKNINGEIKSFIDEQESISDLLIESAEFSQACTYLFDLRKQTVNNTINQDRIDYISYEAERHLCNFIGPLGFIHRYNLVSIQQIEILKYRHTKLTTGLLNPSDAPTIIGEDLYYKHRLIRCMQSTSDDEYDYYYMPSFVDNWSVMLIKTTTEETIDGKKRRFKVTPIDYLNLSPFVIDRNSFVKRANLSYIMFFNGLRKQTPSISYQWVRNPMNYRDSFEITDQEDFEAIRLEFDAFEKMIQVNENKVA